MKAKLINNKTSSSFEFEFDSLQKIMTFHEFADSILTFYLKDVIIGEFLQSEWSYIVGK